MKRYPKDANERAVWAQVAAAADRSDPFAAARIRCHMANGVAADRQIDSDEKLFGKRHAGEFSGYAAEAIREEHSFTVDGEKRTFYLPEYINRSRP